MKRALLALLAVAFLSTGMIFATDTEKSENKCGCCKKEKKPVVKKECCKKSSCGCCKKEKKPVVKKECCKKDCSCKKCCKKERGDKLSCDCKKKSCCNTCSNCCKKGETSAEVIK